MVRWQGFGRMAPHSKAQGQSTLYEANAKSRAGPGMAVAGKDMRMACCYLEF